MKTRQRNAYLCPTMAGAVFWPTTMESLGGCGATTADLAVVVVVGGGGGGDVNTSKSFIILFTADLKSCFQSFFASMLILILFSRIIVQHSEREEEKKYLHSA